LSLFLQSTFSVSIAQSNSIKDEINNHIYHSIKTGLNYNWLKSNIGISGLYNYEFTIGYSVNQFFLEKFSIQLQTLWGIKIKRPYDIGSLAPVSGEADHYFRILNSHHPYFEFPLSLGFSLIPSLEFRLGYSYRFYYGSSIYGKSDFFNNHGEGGIITEFNIKTSGNTSIGSTLFLSTKDIYTFHGITYTSTLRTKYVQIVFKYCFN